MKFTTVNCKTRTFIHLLITRNLSDLAHAIARNCRIISNKIYARGYYLWATLEDVRTGGRCTNKTIASKLWVVRCFCHHMVRRFLHDAVSSFLHPR